MRWVLASTVCVLLATAAAISAADGGAREAREARPDRPKERAAWNAGRHADVLGRVLAENRLKALAKACELAPQAGRSPLVPGLSSTRWQALGPLPAISGYEPLGAVSGRITALAVHPTNPNLLLVGAATGGIWRSTDGGVYFRPVSDDAPALATSSFAFSASNPSVVYAATGEIDSAYLECLPSRSFGTYLGAGLLRSVDTGETWTRIDLNLPANAVVSRVLVHPKDAQLVLAGVYIGQDPLNDQSLAGGLYRSTDGGVHFAKTFDHAVSDLVADPTNPDVVYAAFGLSVSGPCKRPSPASGVYRSGDFGQTLAPALVAGSGAGAPFADPTGQIKLTATGRGPTVLYASILDQNDEHKGGGIFVSSDGGATWAKRSVLGDMCGDQCDYDHFIAADPVDEGTLYFGAVDLYKSTDGAQSWVKLTDFYTLGGNVHPDQHAAAILAGAPRTIYLGNDGGLYRTTDGGGTFQNLNESLTLGQFNGLALGPVDGNFAIGGLQDNGNLRFNGRLTWTDRTGGDGGFNLVRADDATQILSANYYAFLNFSSDGGETFADVTSCSQLMKCTSGSPKEPMAFYPPAAAAPAAPGTVFLATNRVWANPTFGKDAARWAPLGAASLTAGVLTALEVVGDGSSVIWTGSRLGEVFFSTDGGATFAKRSGLPATEVTAIRAVSADGRSAYITFAGFTGAPARHVFRTLDGGQTFVNVTGDLPDVPVLALAVDPNDANVLFAGSDVGVFRSTNGGVNWTSFGDGLPNASVTDLKFHPKTGDLWAATYGRGVFRISAAGVGVAPAANFAFAPDLPAPGESVAFSDRSAGAPLTWSWDFGDGTAPSSERSPRHVYAQPGAYTVRQTVTNAAGSHAKTASLSVVAGVDAPVTLQVPVVLDVAGVPPAHFTSDLVAVNRSGARSRLSIVYLASPGTPGAGGPRLGFTVDAGRELRLPDVIQFLRSNGYAISQGAATGTLRLTFEDVSDPALVFAGSRTSTPNPNLSVGGSFGLFSSATSVSSATLATARIFGLREDAAFRSNLAVVDVPGNGGPVTLSILLVDGDSGFPSGAPQTITLASGEWRQLNGVLRAASLTNGWAEITKTGGGRFISYGVLNDGASSGGGTSDGSFLGSDAAPGLVPIVLRATSGGTVFTSELVLANPTSAAASVTVTYTPSLQLGGAGGGTGTRTLSIPAGQQLRVADAITWLRDTLGLSLLPGDANQGGTLLVAGAVAFARTSNPNPDRAVGGTFGLAYPAVPAAQRARTEAWVYGLVQNAGTRSNLAIADARAGSAAAVTYVIDVFDAVTGDGKTPRSTQTVTLSGGQWYQVSRVLAGAGITNGYVRVRPQSGTADFVVYGVLNDGANPGERTSDGSYVAMSSVQ